MKNFSFYEQCGILIPGAALLLGLIFLAPELRAFFEQGGISVGGFGVFVLAAYAAGHGIAAVGNAIEYLWWLVQGTMPSNWVIGSKPRLLNPAQLKRLEAQIAARLNVAGVDLKTITRKDWEPVFRQLYRDVLVNNPGRVEVFNGNYGLNRGLGSAFVVLAALFAASHRWLAALVLIGAALIHLIRMQRFGLYFAREVFTGFLNLPAKP